MNQTEKLPCPRFELRWERINEPVLDAEQEQVFIDNNMPVPMYDWQCIYSLVIPLQSGDIRIEDDKPEMTVVINVTRAQRNGHPPTSRDGSVTVPWRDGYHANWDRAALGVNIPIVAICDDIVTVMDSESVPA